ncbi:MAG: aldehyde ferredoxin oxidoreductase family protein [Desulfobacterales bacterium]|jgi:aldehyde:ferredoxin oxidoreductase
MSSGKIVEVDLTTGKVTAADYSTDMARTFLGGLGFNSWYLYNHISLTDGALEPENVLVISCGLLTGTAAPSSSRIQLSARSPLSGLMGSSNVGGFFGVKLRTCGIRSMVIRGRSPKPVFLEASPDGIEIKDAGGLWGLNTSETERRLKADLGNKRLEIMSIGPAGENSVRYACVMLGADHAAGRTGMGAVMGSKNLKAIVVHGPRGKQKMDAEISRLVKDYIRQVKASVSRYRDYSTWGSSGDILESHLLGLLGTRNYRKIQFGQARDIDGRHLVNYVTRRISCHRCPVHCKAEVEIPDGKYKGFKGGRPEYETVIDLGALCGVGDPEALLYLSNLCNILGLDSISTGSVIAFAMDLYDRGILSLEDTDGLDLTWGNAEAMEALMINIAHREGLGDIMAQGVRRAAKSLGKGAEKYAYHVKGVEIYGGDPRGMMGTALSYAVSLRGGDFTSVYPVPEFRFTPEKAEKDFGTRAAVDYQASEGKGALVRKCLMVSAIIDSLGICKVPALTIIGDFDLEKEAALTRALTGLEISTPALFRIGERIVNFQKLINLKLGATVDDDTLPEKFRLEPIGEGPARGRRVQELDAMVRSFYSSMGWDKQGVPTKAKLKELGIK